MFASEGLLQRVKEGDRPSLVHLLTYLKYDPNTIQGEEGETLLHLACRNGHFDIVRTLIEVYSCDISIKNKLGNSPLDVACANNQFRVVFYFCEHHKLDNALQTACQAGFLPIVKLIFCYMVFSKNKPKFILKQSIYQDNMIIFQHAANDHKFVDSYGTSINKKWYGIIESCLLLACSNGHLHVLKIFLEEIQIIFQNIDLFANYNSSLMKIACERGHYDIFDYLHNLSLREHFYSVLQILNSDNMYLHPSYKKPSFISFLSLALKRADLPLYNHLEDKVDLLVSEKGSNGDTLLHAACISCDLNMVERVWSTEYIDKKNDEGNTCLHLACEWGSLDIVKFLIAKKFRINDKNYKGQTPLHLCIIYERVDIFKHLLEEDSIDVHAATKDGETLLHLAASNDKWLEIVQIIISTPNSIKLINARDKYGETPIFNACRTGSNTMVSLLVKSESDLLVANVVEENIFHIACRLRKKDILDIIFEAIDNDYPPKLKNCVGQTLLHLACHEGLDMVKYLASMSKYVLSEDINIVDKSNGLTPLQNACRRNDKKLSHYLLECVHDCYADATNFQRETVFHICCKYGIKSMEQLCFDNCSIGLHDSNGDTPLHVAGKKGNYNLLLSILKSRIANTTCRLVDVNHQGDTLLHVLARCDDPEANIVLKFLVEKDICDYKTKNIRTGDTALHIACSNNALLNAEFLLTLEYNEESWYNSSNKGPLNCITDCKSEHFIKSMCFMAPKICTQFRLKVVKVSKSECLGSFETANFMGVLMPLTHYLLFIIGAQSQSQSHCHYKYIIKIIIDFLRKNNSMVSAVDSNGNNLLHYVALCYYDWYNNMNEFYDELIKLNFDLISSVNKDSFSPLHFACLAGNEPVIFKILQHEGSSKLLHEKNIKQETPPDLYINLKNYSVECAAYLIAHGADMDIPSHMLPLYVKECNKNPSISIIVLGDSHVGKTTLVRSLSTMLCGYTLEADFRDEPTTGMVTTDVINSKNNDRYIFRDFAGHAEFEMSHQQWLKSLLSSAAETSVPSPVVFLFVVKGVAHLDHNKRQIDRWFSFVHRHVNINDTNVHTALVCTHDDLFQHDIQRKERKEELKVYFHAKGGHFYNKHDLPFFLNGCKIDTIPMNMLLQYLEGKFIYSGGISLSKSCLELDLYLEKRIQACQVKCLNKEIKQDNQFCLEKTVIKSWPISFLPHEPNKLLQLLMQLHAQNHITLLQVGDDKLDWWIINKSVSNRLSSELNSIFSPKEFKDAPDFRTAHNTGVVPTQELSEIYEHLSLEIQLIESYLVSMEYCKPIEDKYLLKLITGCEITDEGNQHFFFPGLIKKEKELTFASPSPSMHHYYQYGWLFENPQDLGLRFLHLLLLSLTFKFASDDVDSGSKYERRLVLWKTGIFWHTIEGIDILVEVENDRKVIALFRCVSTKEQQLKLANIRFRVISEVESVLKRTCNVTVVKEGKQYILYPPPTDYNNYDTQQVVEVSKLVRKLTKEPDSRIVYTTDTSTASLHDMLGFDSFGCLKTSVLGELKSSDPTLAAQTFDEVESQIGCSNLAQIIGISISDNMRDEFVRMYGSESKSALSAQLSEYSIFKLEDLHF